MPCQTELPGLLKFRDDLERMGGRLVLVSVENDDAAGRIKDYGARFGSAFQSYRAPRGGLADHLDLSYSVPRTFVVAKGGQLLKTYYGSQKWEDASFQDRVRSLLQLRKK